MKSKLLVLLSLIACATAAMAQATSYAGGDGTKDNPYLISNADELAKLAHDVNTEPNFSRGRFFKLTQDIVINEHVVEKDLTTLQGGKAFPQTTMIGNYSGENDYVAFQGVFDGDGHSICGFYSVPNANYVGLFRVLEGATVKNLGFRDCFVYAGAYLSVLAGLVKNSTIINCYVVDSKVNGWGSNSGPLGGHIFGKTLIANCYTAISMITKNDTGGIVGRIGNGTEEQVVIDNCYTTTFISTSKSNKGGVTATNAKGSIVRRCYFTSASAQNAVWPAQDKGTTEDCQQMTLEEMQSDDFVDLLNANSQDIAGASRWQKAEGSTPVHNLAEKTPEDGNQRDVSQMATDPVPADDDTHADMDGDAPTLSWTAARDGKTVSQYLYIGTDSTAIALATPDVATATLGTETHHTLSRLNSLQTYYWRVDRVDADGNTVKGDVWSFQPRHLAFPGAEGYGRFARGGRGGKVVYVTNLDDSGEGSLRWALTNKQGPRTILFKVSGIIDMGFRQCITDDQVTIAAQSAPGKGICIKHSDIGVKSDCVVRYLRARRGLGTSDDTGNAIGTTYSNHTILDHVSASWGTDETFSSRGSQNITFQRSIISEALGIAGHRNYPEGTNHGYAATIGGDIGSFHHNLLADCEGRNWSMGGGTNANGEYAGRLDIFNNVVYNWYKRTTDGGAHEVNFVGNYYKAGIDTKERFLFSLDIEGNLKGTQSAYVSGNIRDEYNGNIVQDREGETYRMNIRDGRPSVDWDYFVDAPFFPSYAKIESAKASYKSVLSDVGANQPLDDQTDQRMVYETLNRTYTYVGSKSKIRGEIDDEMDAGGFEEYPETAWADDFDSDSDGLPDWWEQLHGTDPHSTVGDYSDTNADPDGDGYTSLDDYLDFIAQPHLLMTAGSTQAIDLATLFKGYTAAPQYSIETAGTTVTAQLQGSTLTVTAGQQNGSQSITATVADSEGDSYQRRISVAVTDRTDYTGVRGIRVSDLHERQLFDVSGKRLQGEPQAGGLYLMRGVDAEGRQHTIKVIKR